MKQPHRTAYRERAVLVALHTPDDPASGNGDPLEELAQLADTAGAVAVDRVVQRLSARCPATCVGSGKADEIRDRAAAAKADVVIFDNDLTPAQVRNLEKIFERKVIDRTELILDIFAVHATSKQAKLQVEMAQLEYLLPRLRGQWSHLSRQEGGPGIGQRGPGEKQIEMDRRIARDRVAELRREMRREEGRKKEEVSRRSGNYALALVGYTNAGKSTLMRTLTGADVLVEDRLFSTLDTRTRAWTLGSGIRVLLSDTVGFIRKLPHHLVTSFHATLEEVTAADLLVHVVDAANPEAVAQIDAVKSVLAEIGCADRPTVMLLNQVDRLRDRVGLQILTHRHPEALPVSARTREGLDAFERRVEEHMADRLAVLDLAVPFADGRTIAKLRGSGQVLAERCADSTLEMKVRLARRDAPKYEAFLRQEVRKPKTENRTKTKRPKKRPG